MGLVEKEISGTRLSLSFMISMALLIGTVMCNARPGHAQEFSAAEPQVKSAVNPAQRVTLSGNVHPMAMAKFDQGKVDDSFAADRLYVVLQRSQAQEKALQQFIQDAHTPGTTSYRQWLTPEDFGKRFGPADSDIAAVTSWLESQGLTVNKVHPGRISIEFSGNAAQVSSAFHTAIHSFNINGKTQYANVSDPQIPAALAPVIAGISPMHSFHAKPFLKVGGKTSYNVKTHEATPQWTYPDGSGYVTLELAPSDFAVQYDLGPVYAAGTTGTGQSIGIISESNIDLSLVQAYQTLFSLPANLPTVVVDGNDPGQTDAATEAYLDVEMASAVAPAAKVLLYTSAGTILTDPLLTSGLRAVEDNQVSVISLSYGSCEASLGASGNAAWSNLWEEAAAQGISVFVSTGDGGSAGCDDFDTESFAADGVAVNGMASTPYNIAVGGTDFYYSDYAVGGSALTTQLQGYWSLSSSTNPKTSLLKPVPEQVWNASYGYNTTTGGIYSLANSSIVGGAGGISSAAIYSATGLVSGYPKPTWQAGSGVPADKVRDIPDVSLFASDGYNYSYYPICALPGDCVNTTSAGAVSITSVGGTSASSPAMAAIQALVDQATSARQGQANYVYYALANRNDTENAFHDILIGGDEVPCYQGTSSCVLWSSGQEKGSYAQYAYNTGVGYDRATGLGTIDVANLIKNWSKIVFLPTTTTLTISPTTFAHGVAVSVKATVAPKTGTGTATGNVILDSNDSAAYGNGLGLFTLANGTVTSSISTLPGGTYQLVAKYPGDKTYGSSVSAPVTVTVTAEKGTLASSGWVLNPTDSMVYPLQAGMSIPYGSEVYLDARPVGAAGATSLLGQTAPATGAVSFTDKATAATKTSSVPLNSVGVAEWAPGTLSVGSHAVTAAYIGDNSYTAASASVASVTVFKGTTTMYVAPLETSVAAGGNVTVDLEMYSDYLPLVGTLPTGNVTITLGGQSVTTALKSWTFGTTGNPVQEAVVTFTKVPSGILPLSASYAGDTNWNGSSSLYGSINSTATKPAPTVTLTAGTTSYTPTQIVTMIGTVAGIAGKPAPSGDLYFSWEDGSYYYYATLKPVSATTSSYTLSFPANQLANGSNLFVATFKGDATYSAQSSAPLTIALNGADFSVTTTTQLVPVAIGKPGTGSISINPINSYSGLVTIGCAAPTGITCTPATSSSSVGAGITDSLTISAASTVASGTYTAVVTVTGGGHVHTAQILVSFMATAPPQFSPAGGTYTTAQTVTITDTTPGATIYYTTNGTAATAASTKYTAPVAVKANQILTAVAIAPGYSLGAASSASYVVTLPATTPIFSLNPGTYGAIQTVSIVESTPGATVYYTTNGATPTTSSTKYTGPITVAATETLKAIAVATSYSTSAVASATYTLNLTTAMPTFSVSGGTYTAAQTVTIADSTAGATIYYTLNGSTPTTSSTKYTAPVVVTAAETLKALAIATGYAQSAVNSATYTISLPAATPKLSISTGTYPSAQTVTITDTTAGATIYYTVNGTLPTSTSTKYTGPFTVSSTQTVSAIAIASGFSASATTSATYTIKSTSAVATFYPAPGKYSGALALQITTNAPTATIYYTTNGSVPTTTSAKYTGPLTLTKTQTVRVMAITPGSLLGVITTGTYTIP